MIARTLPSSELIVIDRWLSERTCRNILRDLEFVWWWPSETASLNARGQLEQRQSLCRTSRGSNETWLSGAARRHVRRLEQRLADEIGIESAFLDPWQIVRYRRGELFEEHHDAGLFAESRHGERLATLVLYLDDQPGAGGATVFPQLKRRIFSRAGRLLLWRNLRDDGSIDPLMRHSGTPARRTKTLLTTWLRERSVRTG